jgi:hypothetical protein
VWLSVVAWAFALVFGGPGFAFLVAFLLSLVGLRLVAVGFWA